MKERPILFSAPMVRALLEGRKIQTRRVVKLNASGRAEKGGRNWHLDDPNALLACPYGQPGDRLWVRETWLRTANEEINYRADGGYPEGAAKMLGGWRPSIFMPRHASRILLEITAVRVERLQDISASDAVAEGALNQSAADQFAQVHAIDMYRCIWSGINGAESWDKNPWVWVIEFKRIES